MPVMTKSESAQAVDLWDSDGEAILPWTDSVRAVLQEGLLSGVSQFWSREVRAELAQKMLAEKLPITMRRRSSFQVDDGPLESGVYVEYVETEDDTEW